MLKKDQYTKDEYYMFFIFAVMTIAYLIFFLGCSGCSKTDVSATYPPPIVQPAFTALPPVSIVDGWFGCEYGGVGVLYNGYETDICHNGPVDTDSVHYVEVCPGKIEEDEMAVCVNGELYGLHNKQSEFLIELEAGVYYDNDTAYGCKFTVVKGCEVK